MAHLTSLKAFHAMVAGVALLAMLSTVEAGLNIMGMPMAVHPLGDTMDFSMGGLKVKRDCDDDEDDSDDDKGKDDGSPDLCLEVKPSAWTLSNMYRDQPLFMNFRPRTEEAMLIDNMCFTFFPLPDDQFTYVMYTSTVYRDGSNLIESDIVTDVQLGIFRAASPYCTFKDHVLGYAGCDTFVMYRCALSKECRNKNAMFTFGLSQSCRQISISCLQKIEDIIQSNGIPEQDYVALPMKLPTQCIFEPVCTFKGETVEIYDAIEVIAPITPVVEYFYEEETYAVPLVEEIVIPEVPFYGYDNYYSGYPYVGRPFNGYYGYY